MSEKKFHRCARLEPTFEPKQKETFPMFKKVITLDKNGDNVEKFELMSEDEKLNLRASSPYMDLGDSRASSPLPRDKFEVIDELNSQIDSMTEEEINELKG